MDGPSLARLPARHTYLSTNTDMGGVNLMAMKNGTEMAAMACVDGKPYSCARAARQQPHQARRETAAAAAPWRTSAKCFSRCTTGGQGGRGSCMTSLRSWPE